MAYYNCAKNCLGKCTNLRKIGKKCRMKHRPNEGVRVSCVSPSIDILLHVDSRTAPRV